MKWEYFLDASYFNLWAVRIEGDKDFNSTKLFHITSQEEAKRLCDLLNEYEVELEDSGLTTWVTQMAKHYE